MTTLTPHTGKPARPGPTPHELDVFAAYVRAGSMKDAARDKGLALPTVKNHVRNLYRVLGVETVTEALAMLGWLRIPEDPSSPAAVVDAVIQADVAALSRAERRLRDAITEAERVLAS